MRDRDKTKEQLIKELAETRRRYEKLKALSKGTAGSDQLTNTRGKVIAINGSSHQESALSRDASELQAIFKALPDLYFQLDSQGTILDLRVGRESDLYLSYEMLMGRRIQDAHPRVGKQFDQAIRQVLENKSLAVIEYSIARLPNEQFYEARLAPLGEDQVIVVIRNITERKQAEEQLKFLSFHDPLTKLYNRAYFEQEMQRLERGRSFPVGIIVCDMDALKLANDTLGHNTGDIMLIKAANIIKNTLRQGEIVARIGGDEFAAILPVNDRQVLESVCDRIRATVDAYNATDPKLPISISVGCAICSDALESMYALFKEADSNMYREKLSRSRTASSAIVKTLMKILKARGITAEEQIARIQEWVTHLAGTIGLGRQSLTDLDLLARFHDIGRIGVPSHIHNKPGPLSPEEITEMRRHCEIGYRIARSSSELAPIADWIHKHHEWVDGNGYPLGLRGDEIPIECRVIAIAYAYEAMTNGRPYRKAMPPKAAFAELERCAGTQFDPVLVAEFLKLYRRNPMQKAT
ncbi:MAG: diguanylate cyclase [Thermacetogeniaceae bacterium]